MDPNHGPAYYSPPNAARPQGPGSWIMGAIGNLFGRVPFWLIFTIALLFLARVALEVFGGYFSVLNAPAPSWVGLLVLSMPFLAILVSFVWSRRYRGMRGRGPQGGPGMGSYGDGNSPSNGW